MRPMQPILKTMVCPRKTMQWRRIQCFVQQLFIMLQCAVLTVDLLYAQQTVYETLMMAALLRLPKEVSHAAKERVVRETEYSSQESLFKIHVSASCQLV